MRRRIQGNPGDKEYSFNCDISLIFFFKLHRINNKNIEFDICIDQTTISIKLAKIQTKINLRMFFVCLYNTLRNVKFSTSLQILLNNEFYLTFKLQNL